MKKVISQLTLTVFTIFALTLLLSSARPMGEEPKQYIVIKGSGVSSFEKLEQAVNEKLAEGWHLQGGVSSFNGFQIQAMVK
jgi:hypothetical protein